MPEPYCSPEAARNAATSRYITLHAERNNRPTPPNSTSEVNCTSLMSPRLIKKSVADLWILHYLNASFRAISQKGSIRLTKCVILCVRCEQLHLVEVAHLRYYYINKRKTKFLFGKKENEGNNTCYGFVFFKKQMILYVALTHLIGIICHC